MKRFFFICCVATWLMASGCRKSPSGVSSAGEEKKLILYSWSEYFPKATLEEFTKRTGIEVKVTYYATNEQLMTALATGDAGYDVVIPSDYAVGVLSAQNRIMPLDRSKLPNFKNLDPKLLGLPYDKENRYSVPIFWGTTGLGVNKDVIKEPVDSWTVLFDEKNAGKISMLNDARENFAVALRVMGKSINDRDPADLKAAGEKLKAQTKLVKSYDSDSFDDKLRTGEAALVQGYNGQLAKVVAEKPEKFAYVVPKEGATRWVDNACIPTGAKHPGNAHLFLNFILDPQIAGDMVNEVAYASANQEAKKFVKPAILNDADIYVPDGVLQRCELMSDLGPMAPEVQKMFEEMRAK